MLRLIVIVFAFGLFLINPTSNVVEASNDIELVLIGLVVKETDKKTDKEIKQVPVNFAIVELVDNIYNVKEIAQTKDDGTFHFQLKKGKQYTITLIDAQGQAISKKEISTVNRENPEVMKIVLEANKDFQTSSAISDHIEIDGASIPAAEIDK